MCANSARRGFTPPWQGRRGRSAFNMTMRTLFVVLVITAALVAPFLVLAHGGETEEADHEEMLPLHEEEATEAQGLSLAREIAFSNNNLRIAGIAGIILAFLVAIAMVQTKPASERSKRILFWAIVVVVGTTTIYLAGTTIYLNLSSITGGPVHWHADFRIFACGNELELEQSEGISNRVGTGTFHHHDDNRVHIEGVVTSLREVSLQSFFSAIGGRLTQSGITVPTAQGLETFLNNEPCPDGTRGALQAFVWKVTDLDARTATQEKLEDPRSYVPSPHSQVPPGDCLILEFGPQKDRTDKLCPFWQIAVDKGELIIPSLP